MALCICDKAIIDLKIALVVCDHEMRVHFLLVGHYNK